MLKFFRLEFSDAETSIFRNNWVNTIATDALAPYIPRSSETMLLAMSDKWFLVFHEVGFQLLVPSQYWETMENVNAFLCFLKQGWFWVRAEPMRDNVTKWRRLSLAEPIPRIIPTKYYPSLPVRSGTMAAVVASPTMLYPSRMTVCNFFCM